MRLNNIITSVFNLRPTELNAEQLTSFVNEVEFAAYDKVFKMAKDDDHEYIPLEYPRDSEKELSIPDEFSGVYKSYLFTKIDYYNAEVDRFNMDAQMYETEWNEFASYWRRTHMPKEA